MFTKEAYDDLLKSLKTKNYNGTVEDLYGLLEQAELKTKHSSLYLFFDLTRKHIDKDKIENLDYTINLFEKLIKKYKCKINNQDLLSPSIDFESSKVNSSDDNYCISFSFHDLTSYESDGIMGKSYLRILYGYAGRRKEKEVLFIEEKPYT